MAWKSWGPTTHTQCSVCVCRLGFGVEDFGFGVCGRTSFVYEAEAETEAKAKAEVEAEAEDRRSEGDATTISEAEGGVEVQSRGPEIKCDRTGLSPMVQGDLAR